MISGVFGARTYPQREAFAWPTQTSGVIPARRHSSVARTGEQAPDWDVRCRRVEALTTSAGCRVSHPCHDRTKRLRFPRSDRVMTVSRPVSGTVRMKNADLRVRDRTALMSPQSVLNSIANDGHSRSRVALRSLIVRQCRTPSLRSFTVPRLSEFYGIVIYMYTREHGVPHFHARYGDDEVVVDIATGTVLGGSLRRRQLQMVEEWTALHRAELLDAWNRASSGEPLGTIEPLP